MSLEINFLDYEIDHIPKESEEKLELENGSVQYDPSEQTLVFYDQEKTEKKMVIKIKEIKLNDTYLNNNIIAFEYEKEGKHYLIKIFKTKLDTLSNRSFKILLENIQIETAKTEKKLNRDFPDIITAKKYHNFFGNRVGENLYWNNAYKRNFRRTAGGKCKK